MRLENKTCIVTGAGSGIGRASSLLFANEGALVVCADIDLASANQTAELIHAMGKPADARGVDIGSPEDTTALADWVVGTLGRVDVLFNNAGVSGVGDVLETEPALFDRVMRVNVSGVYLMSRAVVPYMIQQRSGSIINMSSCIAQIGLARRVSYVASKGAVLSMTKSMQVDLAQHGIRVNALMPGTILTPFVERYLRESYSDPAQGLASIRARQLSGELGQPIDVANAALYLASDESRFVMASGLIVDGGRFGRQMTGFRWGGKISVLVGFRAVPACQVQLIV